MGRKNRLLKSAIILLLIFVIVILLSNIYYRLTYPLSYKGLINQYSKEFDIDPYLIAAIINVESNFDKKALSPKEARGLMQITPITGEWAARELSIEDFQVDLLYNPDINIQIGAWYLDQLGREFNQNLQLVLAAYNGGSGNVSKWLENEEYCEDGENLKKIPFEETDKYIDKVLKNHKIYKNLYKDKFNGEMDEDSNSLLYFFHNLRSLIKNFLIKLG